MIDGQRYRYITVDIETKIMILMFLLQIQDIIDLNIFRQDVRFCSKLGLQVEHAKTSKNYLKTSLYHMM